MEITVESVSHLERKMTVVVPASEITPKVEERIKQAASQARIKGFRPGKVPVREVRRRFGEGILQEVASEVMQESYSNAIAQETLKPAGMPQIDDVVIESDKDLSFSATFEENTNNINLKLRSRSTTHVSQSRIWFAKCILGFRYSCPL